MRRALVILACATALVGGCGGGASKDEFEADVVSARNDADAGLAQIVEATSAEDLMERMRIAAVEVRGAATDVREADAPDGLEEERDQLAQDLQALSDEIVATVETFEAIPEQAAATRALNFEEWNNVQSSLALMRSQGVQVLPLGRHKPAAQAG